MHKVKLLDTKLVVDDRAIRIIDVVPHLKEQINISIVNSTDHIVAYHKHETQVDYWTAIKGSFKVVLGIPKEEEQLTLLSNGMRFLEDSSFCYDIKTIYLSDRECKTLIIPPGVLHGYRSMEVGSILHYYLTDKYENNDVSYKPYDFLGKDIWETQNK